MNPGRIRIGVYAWSVSDGAVLLCRIAPGEADAGMWTLPGGGARFGEHPEDALRRELYEETGLAGPATGVLGIDSLHRPAERRPGTPALHALRIVYRVELAGDPRVVEENGSVDRAAWVALDRLGSLPHVALVDFALGAATAAPEA